MTKNRIIDDIRTLYDRFDEPVTGLDCGLKCAPHNPSGKPFCCDICQAVPVAYLEEWQFLKGHTDLWHEWSGRECDSDPVNPETLRADTPAHLRLLACNGPARCQREFRAISCRQFPFFPYITSDFRFIGLAYYREYEHSCWVISHLELVTEAFREAFISVFDEIFDFHMDDFDSYLQLSAETRLFYAGQNRRFPVLHRNGATYLVSPRSEGLRRINQYQLPKFCVYK